MKIGSTRLRASSLRHGAVLLLCGSAMGLGLPGALAAAPEVDAICEKMARTPGLDSPFARVSMPHAPVRLAQADNAQSQAVEKAEAEDEDALAKELAAMIQACSFDGKPVQVRLGSLDADKGAGEEAVREIMRFTGLPQNFTVIEGNVPNAAAMIVLDDRGIPQRVIAYNSGFMQRVRRSTQDNDWAAVSVLAHEIGHHLSGHTLVPGGSQPPIELEADKFSGFVLFKMGAALDDAQKAIATLVPEEDGPTHPGRPKRLAAVQAGWTESCELQPDGCSDDGAAVASVEPVPAPVEPQAPAASGGAGTAALPPMKIPGAASIRMPREHPASGGDAVIPPDAIDRVPVLDASATPRKFDRFVYDEVGVFHPAIKKELADRAFAFAQRHDLEIVTIVAKDLQGRSADDYALDAMRSLRVGKMDVGNGAVLVVAPEAGETGVAVGPGLSIQYESRDQLRGYLDDYLELVAGGARPQIASDMIVDASSRIMRDTQPLEWAIRFQSLEEILKTAEDYRADLKRTGARYDPAADPTWRKLARVRATVVATQADPADRKLGVNTAKQKHSGPAMHVRTAEGQDAVLYVNPNVLALMPSALEEGREYAFVVRDSFLAGATPQYDLVSYDLLR